MNPQDDSITNVEHDDQQQSIGNHAPEQPMPQMPVEKKRPSWLVISLFAAGAILITGSVVAYVLMQKEDKTITPKTEGTTQSVVVADDTEVDDTTESATITLLQQNTKDNAIKTDANRLMSSIAEYVANNRGQLPQQADIVAIQAAGTYHDPETTVHFYDTYSRGDMPPTTKDFYYLPNYGCESPEGPAIAAGPREHAVLFRLTRDKLQCMEM